MQSRYVQQRISSDWPSISSRVGLAASLEGIILRIRTHGHQRRASSHQYGEAPVLVPQRGRFVDALITFDSLALALRMAPALGLEQQAGADLGALAEPHEADPLPGGTRPVIVLHGALELVADLLGGGGRVDFGVVGQPAQPPAIGAHVRVDGQDARTGVAEEGRVGEDEAEGRGEVVDYASRLEAEDFSCNAAACCIGTWLAQARG